MIELRGVVKTFMSGGGPFQALKGIDMTIGEGEFTAVIGRSGSGKSTLLSMITGIDRPTSGEVVVAGTRLHELRRREFASWRGRQVGIVFQFFQLMPALTLLENVMLPMDFCRMYTPKERRSRAERLLGEVGLAEQAHRFPASVSGGQQQRAAIARALANDPPLIVADEPTGSLDSVTADTVFGLFGKLAAQGKTVVLVTHDQTLSARVNRTVVMADGQIVSEGVLRAFPKLDLEQLTQLQSRFRTLRFAPGSVMIREGDPADCAYILISGEAEVVKRGAEGSEAVAARLGPGQYFGEIALVLGGPRTATVRAAGKTETEVLALSADAFSGMLLHSEMTRREIEERIRHRLEELSGFRPEGS
ncbi:ATP-binding cassette domain-containing protein [Paenibacillus sp. S-38]|uniref:ABC transporter ATP-binding protein n=1 Tax=Paenibacillus sp. S-38 TaxID=3416710 RepID=UPI003CF4A811